MQRTKTVDFWNEHHQRKTNQEWIVRPSSNTLIQKLIPLLVPIVQETRNEEIEEKSNGEDNIDKNKSQPSLLLEIGCGTSQLGKEIYSLLNRQGRFVITDVSPICIERSKVRDKKLIQESNGNFNYQVLDAASCTDTSLDGHLFHLLLDKGCLDTFLFRSERKVQNILVENLLNRVHAWMIQYYLVISPRSKIKTLRDFQGFKNVERFILDDDLADLEGVKEAESGLEGKMTMDELSTINTTPVSEEQKQVYLFICTKNNDYVPGVGAAFVDCYEKNANEDLELTCRSCTLLFDNFCLGLPMKKRVRQWKGHRLHCKKI